VTLGEFVISLSDVSKWYLREDPVLTQVHLTLERAGFLYVVGGTGTGKTTLLRMLATEESPSQGSLQLFGYDMARVSPSTLRAIRRVVGYVPQNIRLLSDLTVFENVALSLKLAGQPHLNAEAKSRIHGVLERVGLQGKHGMLASRLSGGEQQRVAVARALARKPELLLADEPTGAQDRTNTWSLMDSLVRANRDGTTVVVATHDPEIVRRVRKRCALLRGGRVFMEDNLCIY
jgi:cell division transport system ATP-binding protein